MLQRSLVNFTIVLLIFCCSYAQVSKAQVPESQSGDTSVPVEKKTGNRDAVRKRRGKAADPESPRLDDELLEEVIVTGEYIEGSGGRRGGTAASRDELDRSDYTSMDDFFDEIDGLSTLGGDDEGNSVSINGLSAELSNVTLNGQSLGQGKGSGGFNTGDLSPDMIRRIDIYKTPTAAMEEGGAGGSVNLQLRNPVDIAAVSSSARTRLSYVPASGDLQPSLNVFSGGPFGGKKFGYMLSVNWSDRDRAYDSQDVSEWFQRDFDGHNAFYPGQVRNNAVNDGQRNVFAGLTLGYRPRRSLDISGKLFVSQKWRDLESHSLQHRFEKQRELDALAFDDRIATDLVTSEPKRENLRIVGNSRNDRTDSLVMGIDVAWRKKSWRLDGALGYSSDDGASGKPTRSATFEANNDFGYHSGPGASLITTYTGGFPENGDFSASRINLTDRSTEDSNRFAGIDVTRQRGGHLFNRFRVGGKIREASRDRQNATARVTIGGDQTLADFTSGRNNRTPWDSVAWPGVDMAAIDDLIDAHHVNWTDNLLNEYDINRRTGAAYVQADFRTGEDKKRFVVGNLGVRIVGTETRIEGYQEADATLTPLQVKTRYTDVLPSASVRVRVAQRAALSFGVAKVLTHPSFNNLAPGIRINHASKTARSGNPDLEPFRANQYLAEYTWVPERGRRVTINLTYRDISSYFAQGEESLEFEDEVYLVQRPVNGDDGYIMSGIFKLDQNLRRLSPLLRNFALSLSWVRNESSTDMRDPYTGKRLPLPNTAEQVARAGITYTRGKFSGKATYQYRGRSLRAADSKSGLSVWNQSTGSLNIGLGWKLAESMQLGLDGRNLLSEEQVQTSDYDGQVWRITEKDRSISVTLRAKW